MKSTVGLANLEKQRTVQREGLGSQVAGFLREEIASGDLPVGARLVEIELAERYGVSRGPVRDAFRVLQAEGLVESNHPGMIVTGIAPEDIDELYSLRTAIETLAVKRLIQRSAPALINRLGRTIEAMRQAAEKDDPDAFGRADITFHSEICALSGHRRLTDVWEQYREVMMMLLRLTVRLKQDLNASAADHRDLFDLIASGDADAASTELASHLEGSRERIVQVWRHHLESRGTGGRNG